MRATYLLGGAPTFTDGEAYQAINNHFVASHVQLMPIVLIDRMLKAYRGYRTDGMGAGWMVNEMMKKMMQITGGVGIYTREQAAAFIAALMNLEKGIIADPYAPMTWSEAYGGSILAGIPWGKIALAGGAFILLYGGVTSYFRSR